MDTVHDMGGMHGFGPVDITDVAAFHAEWEKRVLGVRLAMILAGHSGGELRPHIEAIPGATYLLSRYFERWARGLGSIVVGSGLLTESEIELRAEAHQSGAVEAPAPSPQSAEAHERMAVWLNGARNEGVVVPARFKVGHRARVRRMAPAGHTRCPRYVRGVTGTVERVTGGFARPDTGEHRIEQTYTVQFDLRDLWGDNAEPGALCLDMWEGYLE
jgi:nitrile hydratase beta subunit